MSQTLIDLSPDTLINCPSLLITYEVTQSVCPVKFLMTIHSQSYLAHFIFAHKTVCKIVHKTIKFKHDLNFFELNIFTVF